ncbi:substrate-binding periplasmic protein [Alysiella filiformis]|uniref:Extracellular solute-binding protein, family 3 n=1 Tax=Alysiella filiformis DSM 16848 TaxID=1120981 RepID=A0A286E8K4_9NEIS|nr:transporter substrate-binding domain-containing protein [Alysiella filiformis]QMT32097.1 amino acid ABC transporter substrate-binding protein [Alysiella filiformis]UBQ56993.1 transporter substrate-binding domain-containing protein [Alysiella filiformis DSM 16848]SOD67248.1 extracellular solute-binding protein, family 3 [Alysiella filiformis DSM 16848]
MKQKWYLLHLCAAMLLAACGDDSGSNATNTTKATSAQQHSSSATTTIKVATDATYPPFQYRDEKNNILGIEMDVLNAIGQSEGLKMDFNHYIRNDYQHVLTNNHFDLFASAFYGNAKYPDDVVMSKPFMEAYIVVGLCDDKAGNANIQNIAQLQGKKIAVSKYYGQSMIDLAAKLTGSPNNVMVVDTFYLSARELYNQQVDGVLGANYVLAHFAKEMKKEDTTRFLRVESEEPRQLVFLVNKNNTALLEKLNKGIDTAKANGTIKNLENKWLGGLKPVQ